MSLSSADRAFSQDRNIPFMRGLLLLLLQQVKVQDFLWPFMQSLITTSHWKGIIGKKIASPPYAHSPIAQLIRRITSGV